MSTGAMTNKWGSRHLGRKEMDVEAGDGARLGGLSEQPGLAPLNAARTFDLAAAAVGSEEMAIHL